jgi:hypothetical protein
MGKWRRHMPDLKELIFCHDCSATVSFGALASRHCGSRGPSGPYQSAGKTPVVTE